MILHINLLQHRLSVDILYNRKHKQWKFQLYKTKHAGTPSPNANDDSPNLKGQFDGPSAGALDAESLKIKN